MTIEGLGEYGMVEMDDDEIRGFLSSQRVGVLGLPTDGAPLMRPMSFTYDGTSRLYFLYVLGARSRKAEETDRTSLARFLVYRVDTPFNWTSVLLGGAMERVPESEEDAVREAIDTSWRPDLFERASAAEDTRLYQFDIDEQVGIKHLGLPPGLEPDSADE